MTMRRKAAVAAGLLGVVLFYACLRSAQGPHEGVDVGDAVDGADTTVTEAKPYAPVDSLSIDFGESDTTIAEADGDAGAEESAEGEAPEASSDSDSAPLDTGEYCPDPTFPPRSDGCPCDPPFSTVYPCTKAVLGKTCDYCPTGGSAARYVCSEVFPAEEPSYMQWLSVGALPCPKDAGISDAGTGGDG